MLMLISPPMGQTQKRVKTGVSAQKFIQEWNRLAAQGKTVEDVSAALGMRVELVYARASEYRGNGVQLAKLKRVNNHIDTLVKTFDASEPLSKTREEVIDKLLEMVRQIS